MNPENSPFTPNQPANVGVFTGREQSIEDLLGAVRKAAKGNLQIAWISGERGIGKSSLASFVARLAEQQENAITAHIHLGGVGSLEGMVKEVHLSLLKDNQSKSWGKNLLDIFGERVKRVGLFGVDIDLEISDEDLAAVANNFADSLSQLMEQTLNQRRVLLLVLDDINGLADNPKFAHWLKSMVDSAATHGIEARICLVFVGLEDRLQQMMRNNPSVARIFRPMLKIEPWNRKETETFFRNTFQKGGVAVEDKHLHVLAESSGGLPTVAHEIGDALWRIAESKGINDKDVESGIMAAADAVGARFIKNEVIQELKSEKYRSILRKIAKSQYILGAEFSRKELLSLETLTATEKKGLDNFLQRMRRLGGIVQGKSGERGAYSFPTDMHKLYFFLEASRAQ